ncbi:MAG: hypothetical protein U1C72_01565, partial [Candidatus Pacearchaeota archaeon]|nr:hypothetical protein [Candidatus Pacearchaeota archaeon]
MPEPGEEIVETPGTPAEGGDGGTPEGTPAPEDKGSTVPISRFNEVYKKQKELEEEISTLKTQKGEGKLTEAQEK